MLCNMFVYVISIPLDLAQIRMGGIRNNTVGKKKCLTEKILSRRFSVALINSIMKILIITMKIPSNLQKTEIVFK